jgi:hypothetical protein
MLQEYLMCQQEPAFKMAIQNSLPDFRYKEGSYLGIDENTK